jgi:tetratricopeptide (TPR) repeat protein
VLTLLGGAGVGKSTLARAARARAGGLSLWVPLEDLQHPDAVAERIASGVGLTLDGAASPWAALARGLGDAPRLLVLDNAEHLALAAPLDTLLAACPGVRLLVTSRAPVGAAGEWRLPLGGLPLPDADETDAEVLRANDAVALFERRARPLAPQFDLAAEAADVVRLVHEVEGLPLAIELLAAWRRLMPVREILAELAESLDLLEPATPSERSVRASFARAWQQLGAVEQRVLAGMAVLPGPLDRAQVRVVLQAPLPVLAALADQSLVRAEGDGRFTLHPLIRRCAAPLAQDVPALRERHARQLAQRVAAGDLDGLASAQVDAAWTWATEQADAQVLLPLCRQAYRLIVHRGSRTQWLSRFADARRALLAQAPTVDGRGALDTAARPCAQALLSLLTSWSLFTYALGDLDTSDALAAQALAWARRLDDAAAQSTALTRRAGVAWQRGDYDTALAFGNEALALERQAGITDAQSPSIGVRALALKGLGRYDEAHAIQERLLDERQRGGVASGSLYLFNNLGNLLRLMGRGRDALALLHEGLQWSRTLGAKAEDPFLLTNVALVHETLREPETALRWAEQALQSARETGEPMIEAAALLARARLRAALRQPLAESLTDAHAALRIGHDLGSAPVIVQAVSSVGVVLARGGRRPQGLALVRWAQRQPAFARSEREDAERHLAPLTIDASEEAAALRRLPPETALADVLASLPAPGDV